MVKILNFETVSKARKANTTEYVFLVSPDELGLTDEECGVSPGQKVGLRYRPITSSELGQVLLNIKDVKPPHYIPARDEGIIATCLTEPKLPVGVQSSRVMQNWMPGTVANLAANIQKTSGYDDHDVLTAEEAVDELGNSGDHDKAYYWKLKITAEYQWSFEYWESLPVAERRHRLVLYIAERELEQRAIQESRDAQFQDEVESMVQDEVRRH